jgi:hypothetical protein
MRFSFIPTAAFLLLSFRLSPALAQANAELTTPPQLTKPCGPGEADLILGGYPILRLRGAAGGLAPDQRIAAITDRLTPLLGNPDIHPDDVTVYLPPPKSLYNRYPVIYVLGRHIITVDPATVQAIGGGKTPLQVAKIWAERLQQVLPRVNWRPSNAAETIVPVHPPLTVTPDFTQVGGDSAPVNLRGQIVMVLRGPQPGGMTAAERADLMTSRLARLLSQPGMDAPDAVQVLTPPTGDASLSLLGTPLISITAQDAAAAHLSSPAALAESWGKNLRAALAPKPVPTPTAPSPTAPSIAAPTDQAE